MVSTSGARLLPQGAVRELRAHVLPITTILTPNVPEAKLLLSDAGHSIKDPQCVADLINIAKAVQSLGPEYTLVKGGHLPLKSDGTIATGEAERELVVDILYGNGEVLRIDSPYRKSRNTHGTGCSLACGYFYSNHY
jgi:hydroxymethylpyrimidine kinase/phosphomethylpyrimidine kinase